MTENCTKSARKNKVEIYKKRKSEKRYILCPILSKILFSGYDATMCKFVIAFPFDLPDPNYVKKASQLKVVDKKLPIEAESRDAGASDDSCMIYHYPVEGRDSTSGYASIFI